MAPDTALAATSGEGKYWLPITEGSSGHFISSTFLCLGSDCGNRAMAHGVSYLHHHFGESFQELPVPFVQLLDLKKSEFLVRMIDHRVNSPLTSSCGRLFDAVAALVGIRHSVSYEGQAAIQLENLIVDAEEQAYPIDVESGLIRTRALFEAIVTDLKAGVNVGVISHDGLVHGFVTIANALREQTGIETVCLSGESFQNVYLSEKLQQGLEFDGFRVFTHSEVPPNDGGLSLGQAMIAAHQI
jgi:hydrogenase maturation protein HypF